MREQTVFAFDYGSKRCGIAIGHTLTQTARPLAQINHNTTTQWQTLDALTTEWQPEILIVGLPLNMNDSVGNIGTKAKQFGLQLQQRYQLPIQFVDERLSTRAARERLQQQGIKNPHKAEINSTAAQIILEDWLRWR